MKLSLKDYRSRQLQKEAAKEEEERESIEAKKVKQACLHKIKIWQAEVARIKQEQEQLRLEQERVWKEQEVNATLLTSQARQAPVALGSHTPCYDKHGQELDYHDDVPVATDSQECKSWSNYFQQRGDEYGVQLADSIDTEHRLLQGPTMTLTVSEEAVLLEEEMPTVDMRQFLVGLETLTPAMLSKVSMRIKHLCQLATPVVSPVSMPRESPLVPPPGLPATLTVANPMEQALLKMMSNLGTSPVCQRMPTRPPGVEETEHATALLVEQMSKAPGMLSRKQKYD